MPGTLMEAFKKRHSCYALKRECPLDEKQVEELLGFALQNIPSAFNSQSTRLVLLQGAAYKKFWSMVMEALRKIVPPANFADTEAKINSFAAGSGTVLFFEDTAVVEKLQADYPLYKQNFPPWSDHTSAMHQLALWTMFADAGVGASLQHYNEVVADQARKEWNIDPKWRLVAQMPFGGIAVAPEAKPKLPLSATLKVFR